MKRLLSLGLITCLLVTGCGKAIPSQATIQTSSSSPPTNSVQTTESSTTAPVLTTNPVTASDTTPPNTSAAATITSSTILPTTTSSLPPTTTQLLDIIWQSESNYIDYNKPELYLAAGNQSNLEEKYFNEISKEISIGDNDIENIGAIFRWKQAYFSAYSAGGKFIGKITVNQIMEEKALSGCHDHGLVLVSILRKYGYPAVMVDTAGIQWAWDYGQGKRLDFIGHVFVEVYVNGRWILINSTTGEYVENYDPSNSVIPLANPAESKGYFALFKGLDPQGYGINSNEQLTEYLKLFAAKVSSIEMNFPQYTIKKLT